MRLTNDDNIPSALSRPHPITALPLSVLSRHASLSWSAINDVSVTSLWRRLFSPCTTVESSAGDLVARRFLSRRVEVAWQRNSTSSSPSSLTLLLWSSMATWRQLAGKSSLRCHNPQSVTSNQLLSNSVTLPYDLGGFLNPQLLCDIYGDSRKLQTLHSKSCNRCTLDLHRKTDFKTRMVLKNLCPWQLNPQNCYYKSNKTNKTR